jgi:hypothetical protein
MSHVDPPTPDASDLPVAGVAAPLSYEPDPSVGPQKRPAWVWAIVAVYGLLLLAFVSLPAALVVTSADADAREMLPSVAGFVTALVLAGLSLLIVPVRVRSRRPMTRVRLIWPILGSGVLAALLFTAGGLAVLEYLRMDHDAPWGLLIAGGAVWGAWSVVFAALAFTRPAEAVGMWLHRTVFAGSVLELLVAVPTHVIVRQRDECCAGIATGIGIATGLAVMFVALGPSVLLLYWRRAKQIRR